MPKKIHVPTDRPWEKQTWETAISYTRFKKYYLHVRPEERSLRGAYRLYLMNERGYTEEAARAKMGKHSGGGFSNQAAARGKSGRYPGAMTWAERALAWDEEINGQIERDIEQERREYNRRVMGVAGRALERVEEMLNFPLSTVTTTETVSGEAGEEIHQTVIVRPANWNYASMAKLLSVLDFVTRLAQGAPTEHVQQSGTGLDEALARLQSMPAAQLDAELTRLLADNGHSSEATFSAPTFDEATPARRNGAGPYSNGARNGQH